MDNVKKFPIMIGYQGTPGPCPSWIPWELIAPYEGQAHVNHDQTLERLAERGGLSPEEAFMVMHGRRWTYSETKGHMDTLRVEACAFLDKLVRESQVTQLTKEKDIYLEQNGALITAMREALVHLRGHRPGSPDHAILRAIEVLRAAVMDCSHEWSHIEDSHYFCHKCNDTQDCLCAFVAHADREFCPIHEKKKLISKPEGPCPSCSLTHGQHRPDCRERRVRDTSPLPKQIVDTSPIPPAVDPKVVADALGAEESPFPTAHSLKIHRAVKDMLSEQEDCSCTLAGCNGIKGHPRPDVPATEICGRILPTNVLCGIKIPCPHHGTEFAQKEMP